jgi:hypothetical protein
MLMFSPGWQSGEFDLHRMLALCSIITCRSKCNATSCHFPHRLCTTTLWPPAKSNSTLDGTKERSSSMRATAYPSWEMISNEVCGLRWGQSPWAYFEWSVPTTAPLRWWSKTSWIGIKRTELQSHGITRQRYHDVSANNTTEIFS